MASMAGQPEYVGVTWTWTQPRSSSATSRRMPRPSIVTTGLSGSGTSAARALAGLRRVCVPIFGVPGAARAQRVACWGESPSGPRVRAGEVLHLGHHVTEVLGVQPAATATEPGHHLGHRQGRLVEDL